MMDNVMDHKSCVLCDNIIPLKESTFTEDSLPQLEFKNSQDDPLKSRLKIIFLLRRILDIPQNICCTFLEEHGDPSVWIGCCDSCSVLIENGKNIFDKIMMLQKQFKALQNQIKEQIIGIRTERNFPGGNGPVEEKIRSFIIRENSEENTYSKQMHAEDVFSPSHTNASESTYRPDQSFRPTFPVAPDDTNSICVKSEMDDFGAYPLDVMINVDEANYQANYHSEESDQLGLDGSENAERKNNFDLVEQGEGHLQIILPKLEPQFHTETSHVDLNSIFYDESEEANSNHFPQKTNQRDKHFSSANQRTQTRKKSYECLICGRYFRSSNELNRHTSIHTGEKPFKCNICGKTFSRSHVLTIHQRIHTGEKRFKCNICGKAFSQSSTLVVHERVHTGEKQFKCDVCGKSFSQSSTLKVHQRIHTGEKGFICDICGKAFAQPGTLRIHKKIHTGDKPFKCKFCEKCFSASSNLIGHERTHTGEKRYVCELCGKAYSQSHSLIKHKKVHSVQNCTDVAFKSNK